MLKTMTYKIRQAILVGIVVPLVAACAGPSVSEAETQLCDDLGQLATALQGLGQINAQSTVNELEAARKNVADSYQAVRSSAEAVEQARLNELETAYGDFQKSVDNISGQETLGEAATTITTRAANVVTAREQLFGDLSCP